MLAQKSNPSLQPQSPSHLRTDKLKVRNPSGDGAWIHTSDASVGKPEPKQKEPIVNIQLTR